MSALIALVLGLVQGLCEFLPISSSGHLVLLQTVFGLGEGSFADSALLFDTMLHLGTLAAVVAVMWRDIVSIFKNPLGKLLRYLVIATVPAVIATLLVGDFFEETFKGGLLGVGFLLTAIILVVAERLSAKSGRSFRDMRWADAVGMGVMQAVAIPPGVSRSGSTISGGLLCGLDRTVAARFSFLMSIPAILGATVLQLKEVFERGVESAPWGPIAVGVFAAMISGFFAIKVMLRLISKKKLYGFAIYAAILGALVLLDQFVFNLFFANPLA